MHATIRRYEGIKATSDELARDIHHLVTNLSQAPGFISFLALEVDAGVLATVSLFEDQDSLAQAYRLLTALPEHHATLLSVHSQAATGEIVFQRGI